MQTGRKSPGKTRLDHKVAAPTSGGIIGDWRSSGAARQSVDRADHQRFLSTFSSKDLSSTTKLKLRTGTGFCKGTKVAAETTEIPIENLRRGDKVKTLENGLQEVVWAGQVFETAPTYRDAVLFHKSVMGTRQDLVLWPNQRLVISNWRLSVLFGDDEFLVTAKSLVNATTISYQTTAQDARYGLLFKGAEFFFADHVAVESLNIHDIDDAFPRYSGTASKQILGRGPELDDWSSAPRPSLTPEECLVLGNAMKTERGLV